MTIAITRGVSDRINDCEITHIGRSVIDVDRARRQHHEYIAALAALGCRNIELPALHHLPDSVFIEDTAFVLPDLAVITRLGAPSRRPETRFTEIELEKHLPLVRITEPATLDGGDVLVVEGRVYIGLSSRSNHHSIEQLRSLLYDRGIQVEGIPLSHCLHLKSAVTKLDDASILVNPQWVEAARFTNFNVVEIDSEEPFAANCLSINGTILYATAFPGTRRILEARGWRVYPIEMDELAKAEGAITCCSLIIDE